MNRRPVARPGTLTSMAVGRPPRGSYILSMLPVCKTAIGEEGEEGEGGDVGAVVQAAEVVSVPGAALLIFSWLAECVDEGEEDNRDTVGKPAHWRATQGCFTASLSVPCAVLKSQSLNSQSSGPERLECVQNTIKARIMKL